MSATDPAPRPEDPVRRDDELLDALRHGAVPADDPVAALLGGWQAQVEARAVELEGRPWPALDRRSADDQPAPADPAGTAPVRAVPPARKQGRPADPAGAPEPGEPAGTGLGRGRSDGRRRRARVLSGAALTLVTLAGGLGLGSARAEPGGLLWPVTELVWTERADALVAEREIDGMLDQARRDLGAGRYAEARTDLERAAALLGRLGDGPSATRIREDLADLWRHLPAGDGTPVPSPAPPGAPATMPPPPGAPDTMPPPPGAPDTMPPGAGAGDDVGTAPAVVPPAGGDPGPDPGHSGTPGHPTRQPATTSPATAPATTAPLTGAGRDGHTAPLRPAPHKAPHTAPDRPGPGTAPARPGPGTAPARPAPGTRANRPNPGAAADRPDTAPGAAADRPDTAPGADQRDRASAAERRGSAADRPRATADRPSPGESPPADPPPGAGAIPPAASRPAMSIKKFASDSGPLPTQSS
ncbi:hypothetical protein [Micromonospora chersina]|uniref:Anti-sigma-D factor RsdA to sigma factor binding region n=1 Tax=Micromonospora chersina TaxID=47854 RepID=A0A1C6UN45_9ACTN|nr:hypothetical protein [Micromonospora chersina]SCL55434.1 hypothetical protein GA0070603_2006 [Micromonospora chersina]